MANCRQHGQLTSRYPIRTHHDWSDLAPLADQVRREGWGQETTTPKVKHRLATHVAPEGPEDVTEANRKWLASAAIHQGGHREPFLIELGHHLDARTPSSRAEVAQTLSDLAQDPTRSLDEAVGIAEAHGFDAYAWASNRERGPYALAQAYSREQVARQALKNMDSTLGQSVYTVARVNASERFTSAEREQVINRLGATASAAFHAFRSELLVQLHRPQPRPMSEIVILGAQHEGILGDRVVEYGRPRTVRLQVVLVNCQDTYSRSERRLAAYELADSNQPVQRLGYLPGDTARRAGNYLATLKTSAGKKRIEGTLSPLRPESAPQDYGVGDDT